MGTFLSRDPVESELPYAYVRGNPVNLIDSSGYEPNREEAGTTYMYSCNCGWIDWTHAGPGNAYNIIEQVAGVQQTNVGFAPITAEIAERRGPYPFIGVIEGGVIGRFAVYTNLTSWQAQLEVALGIFISLNNQFENYQGGNFPGWWGLPREWVDTSDIINKHSSFSEEDLVSDLIGFYRAAALYLATPEDPIGLDPNEFQNAVLNSSQAYYERICDVVGRDRPDFIQIQQRIFDEYNHPFIDNRIWGRPRLDGWDGSIEGKDCPTKACKQPRRLPAELTQIQPMPPLAGWGWISGDYFFSVNDFGHPLDPDALNQDPLNWNPY